MSRRAARRPLAKTSTAGPGAPQGLTVNPPNGFYIWIGSIYDYATITTPPPLTLSLALKHFTHRRRVNHSRTKLGHLGLHSAPGSSAS